ncbi:MAG: hypothetical protein P8Z75_07935 [Gammaproteobacteria bacterium]
MLNILQWLAARLRAWRAVSVERRCGRERRQGADRRREPRFGEPLASRRLRQRRYI